MKARRTALVAVLLLTAVVLQVSVLSRLDLPGATPDLVLVTVVAIALALGPGVGAAAGFAAGLTLDLVPPAVGTVGLTPLLLAVAGYATGAVLDPEDHPVLPSLGLVVVAAGGVILGQAVLGTLVGDPRVLWDDVPSLVLSGVVYALLLSPFVLPLVAALARRLAPVPT